MQIQHFIGKIEILILTNKQKFQTLYIITLYLLLPYYYELIQHL